MGRCQMSETWKPFARAGAIWKRALIAALGLSLIVNLALAIKIAVFDPNHPFRIICYVDRHVGFLELSDPVGDRFRERILANPSHSKRLGRNGTVYISSWDWWFEKDWHWNLTRQIAERIYFERTGKRITEENRDKLQTNRCGFIRRYVLEKRTRAKSKGN